MGLAAMTIIELAQLYVLSRVISDGHKQHILRVARRFQIATGVGSIEEITSQHLAAFVRWLDTLTGNVNTKANYLDHVRLLLRYAARCGLSDKVPMFPEIRRARRVPRAWSYEEFRRLYDIANRLPGRVGVHLARLWWASLIAVAYHTGSRVGALLKVRWRDLDMQTGLLVLRAENTKTRTEQVFRLPDYVVSKIKELAWPRREFIWDWPYNKRYFWVVFRSKIARPAKLEPLPGERFGLFHKIRRTTASLAAAQGGIAAAQLLLGHSSPKTTIHHYIDPRIAVSDSVNLPGLE